MDESLERGVEVYPMSGHPPEDNNNVGDETAGLVSDAVDGYPDYNIPGVALAEVAGNEIAFTYAQDQHRYVQCEGEPKQDAGAVADAMAVSIREMRDETFFDGQGNINKQDKAVITSVYSGVVALQSALKIPLEQRFPPIRDWHPFDNPEDLTTAAASVGKEAGLRALHHISAGILWLRDPDHTTTLSVLGHAVSEELAVVRASYVGERGIQLSSGYAPLLGNAPSALDDITHEIASGRIQEVVQPGITRYTYGGLVPFGHAAVEAIANHLSVDPRAAENILLRGAYDSSTTALALEILEETLGTERLNRLSRLNPDMEDDQIIATARDMNLPTAAKLVEDERAGRGFHAFQWNRA
jgi:hypothetical protein